MKIFTFNHLAEITLFVIVNFIVFDVKSSPLIDEITIPITGTYYDSLNGHFTISGRPNSLTSVFYDPGYTPTPETYNFTIFNLSTNNLTGTVSANGSKIDYTSTGSFGNLNLLDGDNSFSSLLEGQLVSLSLEVIDSSLGAFDGYAEFNITGGALAADFSDSGELSFLGIAFLTPADFNSSFSALSNTHLYPKIAPAPETSQGALVAVALLCLTVMIRKRKNNH